MARVFSPVSLTLTVGSRTHNLSPPLPKGRGGAGHAFVTAARGGATRPLEGTAAEPRARGAGRAAVASAARAAETARRSSSDVRAWVRPLPPAPNHTAAHAPGNRAADAPRPSGCPDRPPRPPRPVAGRIA